MSEELGMSVKKEDFNEWYLEVIKKAGLANYSSVSGCMVIRPYAYNIWENVKKLLDERFQKLGVKNAYFPLFIPEKLLKKEEQHVEGFSPEVAWVTEAGSSKLDEKLAIRPTSETIMYESYSKWIRSHRDLPLK
ncbi:MAG: proline--tRNA ligase, partial [Candidatus Aenigmarchaeota archaeon]|nr:proline--tRNA ligase [Candidatus Aenigmarchaeota archaeon]